MKIGFVMFLSHYFYRLTDFNYLCDWKIIY